MRATQGRPSRNRANPGLNDPIPLGLTNGFLSHIAEPAIAIPLKTSRNHFFRQADKRGDDRTSEIWILNFEIEVLGPPPPLWKWD